MSMPPIVKTPGEFEGAQFCFEDLFKLRAEEEVQPLYLYNVVTDLHIKPLI